MAWEDFFNHKCNIYHAVEGKADLGYGLSDDHKFSYPDEADISDVPCHFHVSVAGGAATVTQTEPLNEFYARLKLSLPINTDIRINDKIVSLETGFSYIAELPRKVQNHHIIVYASRNGAVKEMI